MQSYQTLTTTNLHKYCKNFIAILILGRRSIIQKAFNPSVDGALDAALGFRPALSFCVNNGEPPCWVDLTVKHKNAME